MSRKPLTETDSLGRALPSAEVRAARAAAGVKARTSVSRAVQRVVDEWASLTDDEINRLAIAVWPRVQAAAYGLGMADGVRKAAGFLSDKLDEVTK